MRSIKLLALSICLLLTVTIQAEDKKMGEKTDQLSTWQGKEIIVKEKRFIPSGDIAAIDIAGPDERWEFAQKEWCQYAANMGQKLIELADLDLSKYSWSFTEEYAHTPERLMDGREVAGYFIMIKDGKITSGAGVPQEALDLPGFHVNVEWGLIAQPSAFFYGPSIRGGGRGGESKALRQELEAAGFGRDKATLRTPKTNKVGPAWPDGIGQALGKDSDKGGGLHNFTAVHLFSSPEVKDLPQGPWGVPIFSEMTKQQKTDFLKLIGRL